GPEPAKRSALRSGALAGNASKRFVAGAQECAGNVLATVFNGLPKPRLAVLVNPVVSAVHRVPETIPDTSLVAVQTTRNRRELPFGNFRDDPRSWTLKGQSSADTPCDGLPEGLSPTATRMLLG